LRGVLPLELVSGGAVLKLTLAPTEGEIIVFRY
jgi:hypothetical protein